eukprot:6191107-Pleurochrysis_carterae.AAC.2
MIVFVGEQACPLSLWTAASRVLATCQRCMAGDFSRGASSSRFDASSTGAAGKDCLPSYEGGSSGSAASGRGAASCDSAMAKSHARIEMKTSRAQSRM